MVAGSNLNAEEVIVGSFGHVYVADKGTDIPEDIDAAITAMADTGTWQDLGYISEDGLASTFGKDITEIRAWQAQDPIRNIVNSRSGSFTCQLMQVNENTLPFALGGGEWTPGTGNQFVYEFPLASDPVDERAMLIDVEDGDTQIVLAFYRAQVTGDVTQTFARGQSGNLAVTISFLSDPDAGNIGRIVGDQDLTS
ncbi:MAG: hypothetical protein ACRDH7_09295 [Actinomycetota bacterium]